MPNTPLSPWSLINHRRASKQASKLGSTHPSAPVTSDSLEQGAYLSYTRNSSGVRYRSSPTRDDAASFPLAVQQGQVVPGLLRDRAVSPAIRSHADRCGWRWNTNYLSCVSRASASRAEPSLHMPVPPGPKKKPSNKSSPFPSLQSCVPSPKPMPNPIPTSCVAPPSAMLDALPCTGKLSRKSRSLWKPRSGYAELILWP